MKATSTSPLRISFLFFLLLGFTTAYSFELQCPPNKTISCGDDIYNLSLYGNAQYKDYSGWHDAGDAIVHYDLDHCGIGEIVRTWVVYNPYASAYETCSQVIWVGGSYFNENNINWPNSPIDVFGCSPDISPNALPPGYQKPTWSSGTCAMIGSSYSDKVFYFNGACKKIIREWEIINCCNYDPYTGEGIFKYYQEINITISDIPQITCASDITVESFDCNGAYVEIDGIGIPNNECSELATTMNDSPYANSGEDASGNYPIGTTTVTFTADFGCWQKTMCQIDVTVEDATTPTPYCIYGLSVALMGIDDDGDGENEDGMIDVWASDLDKGSFASCNSNSPLTFSFSSDPNDDVRTFTCDDVGRNDVEIWVTDKNGQQNYCNTYIRVQNNNANIPDCEDSDDFSLISGHVSSHHGKSMGYMSVMAEATSHEGIPSEHDVTSVIENIIDSTVNSSGTKIYIFEYDTITETVVTMNYPKSYHYAYQYTNNYSFGDLAHFHDYKIFGIAEDPDFELINKSDKHELQAYLDGKIEFTAYQKMAADMNTDGVIDQEDLDILNSILQGNPPANFDTKWHFMDQGFDVANMDENHECEEFCRVSDLKNDTYKVNLIGYRLGDITDAKTLETDDEGNNHNELAQDNVEIFSSIEIRSTSVKINTFDISPNPFDGRLKLSVDSADEQDRTFILRNELGQVVFVQNIHINKGNHDYSLDVSRVDGNGIYFYELNSGEDRVSGKLVKIK